MCAEFLSVFFRNIQNLQFRVPGMQSVCHFDPIRCGQQRFYQQQVNGPGTVAHNVVDIGGCAGFHDRVTLQAQNLTEHRPRRVVIIYK
jgi:hypothetical protein